MRLGNLRCERLVDPLAVGTPRPRLGWRIVTGDADGRGVDQTAYRILCASNLSVLGEGKADLWDSGRVEGSELEARYDGRRLASLEQVVWTVRAWDGAGRASAWARPAEFGVGHLKATDWRASWIGVGLKARHPAPHFRRRFTLASLPVRAILHASALGIYEIHVNGRRVGDQELMPEWTSYHRRLHYQSFDVTELMRRGENVIGAVLADGWYAGRIGLANIDPRSKGWGLYGDEIGFLAELRLESSASRRVVATDRSWKCTTEGPVLSADLLDGVLEDARRRMPGWDAPGFDDTTWKRVRVMETVRRRPVPQPNEPIRVLREVRPVEITEPARGLYVVNLGQNITGWARVTIREASGRIMTIRHGERLKPDGRLYTENLRGAAQTDTFIAAGDGDETFEPRLTYHGFQYLEIHGLTRKPRRTDITGCALWSSSEEAGTLETSNPILNRLLSNIVWTQRDNMTGVPTDCPQRDERLGWAGDIQIFCPTGMYAMDMEAFLTKWLADLRDDQAEDGRFPDFAPHPFGPNQRFSGAPGWGDAGVVVPWRMYVSYGNRAILSDMFEPALRWVRWVAAENPDRLWRNKRFNDYGEWLNADTFTWDRYPKGRAELPKEVFATLMFYRSAGLLARIASVLGRGEEERELGSLARAVAEAFHAAYVDPEGRIRGDTQAGYALALNFRILRPEEEARAFSHLERCIAEFGGRLSTGIHATVPAMHELARRGRVSLAYELLESTSFPSWGYTIEHGGTTIWERWDGWTEERGFQAPSMNSFCHYAIGAVGEWMFSTILGIRPSEEAPGYREFDVRPMPGGTLLHAHGHHDSIRGRIEVAWRIESGSLRLEVTVPPTSRARVWVPGEEARCAEPRGAQPGGARPQGVESLGRRDGCELFKVGSGTYVFTTAWKG